MAAMERTMNQNFSTVFCGLMIGQISEQWQAKDGGAGMQTHFLK
jgi:hypothetical protein